MKQSFVAFFSLHLSLSSAQNLCGNAASMSQFICPAEPQTLLSQPPNKRLSMTDRTPHQPVSTAVLLSLSSQNASQDVAIRRTLQTPELLEPKTLPLEAAGTVDNRRHTKGLLQGHPPRRAAYFFLPLDLPFEAAFELVEATLDARDGAAELALDLTLSNALFCGHTLLAREVS